LENNGKIDLEAMAKQILGIASQAGEPIIEPNLTVRAADNHTEISSEIHFDQELESNQYIIREAIQAKYGEQEAELYRPGQNVKTKGKWISEGWNIRDGEIALCLFTDKRRGVKFSILLFHQLQMELLG